jgi:hypothetical protein
MLLWFWRTEDGKQYSPVQLETKHPKFQLMVDKSLRKDNRLLLVESFSDLEQMK